MEKLLNWWMIILLIILFGALSIFLVVGPLLLGLLVKPYYFLLYIITFVLSVPLCYFWRYIIPDLIYELL